MPCPNCGGNYAHESAVGDTRMCNCTSASWTTFTTGDPITIQMPDEPIMSIHIDSLPGGTGYAMGVAAERSRILAAVKRLPRHASKPLEATDYPYITEVGVVLEDVITVIEQPE